MFLLKASGLLMMIVAILLHILQPYTSIFRWKLIFAENGEIFNLWQNPPVELYIKIYLYNITNAAAFMAGTEPKLRVQQVGPYAYRERLVHEQVVFNGNGTLTAVPKHPLQWNAEMSDGHREDDMFMVPNIALLVSQSFNGFISLFIKIVLVFANFGTFPQSIAQVTAEKSFFFRTPVNMLIRQTRSEPIVRMTAREFMFGYGSTLTTLGNQLMPNWIYFEKVGLIDRMYDFDGDVETVFTGELDSTTSGLIDTYRGSPQLKQWKEPHCSDIHMASDGTKFKSFIAENETLLFYRKSMCRAQRLVSWMWINVQLKWTDAHTLFVSVASRQQHTGAVGPVNSLSVRVREERHGQRGRRRAQQVLLSHTGNVLAVRPAGRVRLLLRISDCAQLPAFLGLRRTDPGACAGQPAESQRAQFVRDDSAGMWLPRGWHLSSSSSSVAFNVFVSLVIRRCRVCR